MLSVILVFAATLFERFVGYPRPLLNAVGHPVMWMGKLIDILEKRGNDPLLSQERRRRNGYVMLAILIAVTLVITVFISALLPSGPLGWAVKIFLASTLIAQKELGRAVGAVAEGLRSSLSEGREAVSHIVGRDAKELGEDGVARGAIESLAENTSDGIIAPIFYLFFFGLPGIAVYKAINTADSMVGHKNERFSAFGFASAKLDDFANFLPARLSAFLFAATARFSKQMDSDAAWRSVKRDAKHHRSPNAGWPEAALAGAIGVKLGGVRNYDGETVELATMGEGKEVLEADDIDRALKLYGHMLTLTLALLLGLAMIFG
ncbi:adenosylcobinamide-phosphate synthase CbiB [Maritalea sp.]|uniref:adenosylcobinamide-phosphate synthase CbiB n=1 Tax=Maritalea sp. TaxID=2003361 RepID=UPI003EF73962